MAEPSGRDVLVCRLTMPVIVVTVISIYATGVAGLPEVVVVECAWILYRIMATVVWCTLARKSDLPDGLVLAAGQLILVLVLALDSPLRLVLGASPLLTMGVAVTAVTLSSAFMFDEKKYAKLHETETAGVSPAEVVAAKAERYGLSQQERRICELVLEGKSTEDIRSELFIAQSTLKAHMRNLYGKVGVHSRDELVRKLRER